MALSNSSHNTDSNNVQMDDESVIVKYSKNKKNGFDYIDAGSLFFRKPILDYFNALSPYFPKCSMEEDTFPTLIADRQLAGFITNERYYDIGTIDRLEVFKELKWW